MLCRPYISGQGQGDDNDDNRSFRFLIKNMYFSTFMYINYSKFFLREIIFLLFNKFLSHKDPKDICLGSEVMYLIYASVKERLIQALTSTGGMCKNLMPCAILPFNLTSHYLICGVTLSNEKA